jgi:hypothetical protein
MVKKLREIRIRATIRDWYFNNKGSIEGTIWDDTWGHTQNGTKYVIHDFRSVNPTWNEGKAFLVRTYTCNFLLPKDAQKKDINNGVRQDQF